MTDGIATIREALNKPWCPNLGNTSPEMHSGCSYCADHEDAVAALDRVAALLERQALGNVDRSRLPITTRRLIEREEQAERELAEEREEHSATRESVNGWREAREAERVVKEQAERERDEMVQVAANYEAERDEQFSGRVQANRRARDAEARVRELTALLGRIRQWDHLDGAGDGPFWKREIDAALAATKEPA
jgi:hypothetical protein